MEAGERTARIVELDGVRGMAALLVVYCHLFLMWVPASPAPVFWLRTLSGLSWTGVHLFFILSGYLIGGILLRQRSSANYFSAFYIRRAFRILPLYFFVLAVFFFVRHFGASLGDAVFASGKIPLWSYPLLVQNFPMAATCDWGPPPLSVTWSVALEEQFYLLLPLLIRALPERFQFRTFAFIAASGLAFRFFLPVCHAPFLLPGSFEPLFGGVLLAWASLHFPLSFRSKNCRLASLAIFSLSAIGMAGIATGKLQPGAADVSVFTLFWGTFLWLVIANIGSPLTAPLRWKPMRWIGGISYGVYLFHPVVYDFLFVKILGTLPSHDAGTPGILLSCAAFALTLALAAASFYFVERKLIAIGHRYRYRPGTAARSA